MAKQICNCANPPGGRVTCEPDQIAICRVDVHGEVDAECVDIPKGPIRTDRIRFYSWVLELVTKRRRIASVALSAVERQIIGSGYYESPTGDRVQFLLPQHFDDGSPVPALP